MFKSCWDWLILIATFYVAVVVPYNASFVTDERSSVFIDVVVEVLFFIGKIYNDLTENQEYYFIYNITEKKQQQFAFTQRWVNLFFKRANLHESNSINGHA